MSVTTTSATRSGGAMAILAGLLGALVVAASAMAQSSPMPNAIGEAFVPDILQRDVNMFVEELELDEVQRVIFETLYEDYEATFRERISAVRRRLAELQPDQAQVDEARRRLQDEAREELTELLAEMSRMKKEQSGEDAQRQIIELYRKRSEEIRAKLRASRRSEVDNERLRQVLDGYREVLEEWTLEKRQLQSGLMDNVQLLLNQQQEERWPAFERRFRREKTLSKGELSGESVNLFHLIREMDLEAVYREAVAEPLAAYDVALDAALRQRNYYLPTAQRELATAAETGDVARAEVVLHRQIELQVAVRDVNDAFTETMTRALTPDLGRQFRELANSRGYPRVYRTTRAQQMFDEARRLAGPSSEILSAIDELEARYGAELAGVNEQLIPTVRQYEPEETMYRTLRRIDRDAADEMAWSEDLIAAGLRLRHEMDQRYIEELEAFLAPELAERLRRMRQGPGANENGRREDSRADDRAP